MNFLKVFAEYRIFRVLMMGLIFFNILPVSSAEDNLNPFTIDKILAVVNNEPITQTDVDRVLAALEAEYRSIYADPEEITEKLKEAKKNIINQMIEEKLVLSAAKSYEFDVDEDTIEARLEQIKQTFPSEEVFEQALERQGLTLKDLRTRFRNQEIMKKAVDYFVRSKIKIDPQQINLYYQSHQGQFTHPEKAKVKSILIKKDASSKFDALKKAKMVLERLKKGEAFEELAKEYSYAASASEGGNLGFIEKGQLIKQIDEAIFGLESGEFTDVIKTPQGYRIFKLEEKEPKRPLSFSEAQDQIKDILYRQKFSEKFEEWINQLRESAYIQIRGNLK